MFVQPEVGRGILFSWARQDKTGQDRGHRQHRFHTKRDTGDTGDTGATGSTGDTGAQGKQGIRATEHKWALSVLLFNYCFLFPWNRLRRILKTFQQCSWAADHFMP